MFKFWKLEGSLFFAPDGGGAGGDGDYSEGDSGGGGEASDGLEHPSYEHPVQGDDDGAGDGDGQAGAGDQSAGGKRKAAPVDVIPKHRLDEVIAQRGEFESRLQATEAENKRFKALLANALGIVDPNAPAKKEFTPREKAVQAKILEMFPWMKDLESLASKKDVLEQLAGSVPEYQANNQRYWDRVAQNTLGYLDEEVAKAFLGGNKKAKDLPPETQKQFRQNFLSWVRADEERQDRYESMDQGLVTDFVKEMDLAYMAPLRRRYGADAMNRSGAAARLPIGGNSSNPTGTGKPKVKTAPDEDAAADAAWKNFTERMNANA